MDVCSIIKTRLQGLGFDQKDLVAAAEVAESFISQLPIRKKLPPAPDRTDVYEKMGGLLRLSRGEMATLARTQGWMRSDGISKSRKGHSSRRPGNWYCRSAPRHIGNKCGRSSSESHSANLKDS